MTVLITSTGSVKTKLFRCDFVITPQLLEKLENTVNERFSGMSVNAVTPAFMQTTAAAFGEMSMLMANALTAVHEAANEAASTGVFIKGQANLFTMPELEFRLFLLPANVLTIQDFSIRQPKLPYQVFWKLLKLL